MVNRNSWRLSGGCPCRYSLSGCPKTIPDTRQFRSGSQRLEQKKYVSIDLSDCLSDKKIHQYIASSDAHTPLYWTLISGAAPRIWGMNVERGKGPGRLEWTSVRLFTFLQDSNVGSSFFLFFLTRSGGWRGRCTVNEELCTRNCWLWLWVYVQSQNRCGLDGGRRSVWTGVQTDKTADEFQRNTHQKLWEVSRKTRRPDLT